MINRFGIVVLFLLAVSCGPESSTEVKTKVASSQASNSCDVYETNITKAGFEIVEKYSCDVNNSCLFVWNDNNVKIAGFLDDAKKLAVQWEWSPFPRSKGWNTDEPAHGTDGWEFTDERYFGAIITQYARVDIMDDESLIVNVSKETNKAGLTLFPKVFAKTLTNCNKVQ